MLKDILDPGAIVQIRRLKLSRTKISMSPKFDLIVR